MKKSFVALSLASLSSLSFADGLNLTSVTDKLVASDVTTPVLAIAGTLATIYVAIKAVKIVLRMVRGG